MRCFVRYIDTRTNGRAPLPIKNLPTRAAAMACKSIRYRSDSLLLDTTSPIIYGQRCCFEIMLKSLLGLYEHLTSTISRSLMYNEKSHFSSLNQMAMGSATVRAKTKTRADC